MQFWAIVVDSLREALDRKIFWLLVAISVLVALAMLSVGFEADRTTFFFGLYSTETGSYNPYMVLGRTRIVGIVVHMLMSFFLAWVGVILMLVATASMFPSMTQRGTIDVLAAKPIGRSRLFLYKYLASMVFVLLQSTVFVGLTFLVMGFRWHVWVPGYLVSIPLMVVLFSYLYCVSVLVGVKTRSTTAAILLSLAAWVVFAAPSNTLGVFDAMPHLKKDYAQAYRAVRVLGWILPKTAEIPYLAAQWAGAGTSLEALPEGVTMATDAMDPDTLDEANATERRLLNTDPLVSIGTSLAFEAAVVLLAMWVFVRKDF